MFFKRCFFSNLIKKYLNRLVRNSILPRKLARELLVSIVKFRKKGDMSIEQMCKAWVSSLKYMKCSFVILVDNLKDSKIT